MVAVKFMIDNHFDLETRKLFKWLIAHSFVSALVLIIQIMNKDRTLELIMIFIQIGLTVFSALYEFIQFT